MKQKGILERIGEKLSEVIGQQHVAPVGDPNNDQKLLQQALSQIPQFKNTKSNGKKVLTSDSLSGYSLTIDNKVYFAFIYPVLNAQVLEFLVNAAKKDNINGIIAVKDHVCLVREYKGLPMAPKIPEGK